MRPRTSQGRAGLRAAVATLLLGGLGLSGIIGAAPGVATASTVPTCSGGTCTVTLTTSGLQSFTAPDGVLSLAVTVEGGGARSFLNSGTVGGGMSGGTLGTTPGTAYEVLVGGLGSGGTANFGTAAGGTAVNGGGGAGGGGPNDGSGDGSLGAGGGGGGSFVFTSAGVPLLVAGGAGGNAGGVCTGGAGGGAGFPPSAGGAISGYTTACTLGGGAAGASAGGTAGPAGNGGSSGAAGSGPAAGSLPGAGGAGGTGSTSSGYGSAGGGGGGGGYYGGGGGGGSAKYETSYAGGGGGGSGYAASTVADVTGAAGANGGGGVVKFVCTDPVATGTPSYDAGSGQAQIIGAVNGLASSAAGTSGPAGDTLAVTVPSTTTAEGGTVAVNANGGFTYTSAAGFTGTDSFAYTVTDTTDGSGDYATGTATIDVVTAVQVFPSILPAGQFGSTYHQSLAVSGGTGPYTWSVSSGPMPPGLSLSSSGLLSGTPTAAGDVQLRRGGDRLQHARRDKHHPGPVAHGRPGPPQHHRVQPSHDLWRGGAGHNPRLLAASWTGDTAGSLTTPPTCSTTATSTSPVGSYPSTCSGAVDSNYDITYTAGSVSVGRAPLSITASSPAMAYGGAVPAITPIYSGLVAGDTAASLTTPPTCSTTATSSSPPGTYPSSCSGAVDSNYDITYSAGSVTVGTTVLTITATSATMAYGGAVPAITPVYRGFVDGDTPASLTTPPTCSTAATSSSPPGTYSATCSGAVDANYAIGYVAGTVTVAPAPLTITATSATMTYGGAVPAITPSYGGFVNGDTAASLTTAPTCSTTATSSSPPGTYPATCSGAVDANYAIGYVAGTVTVAAGTSSGGPRRRHDHHHTGAASRGLPRCRYRLPERGHRPFWGQRLRPRRGEGLCRAGSSLAAVQRVDHAKVVPAPAGATAPTAVALRPGTLLSTRAVNGVPTIYVAGTDGQLHGFSTSGQFFRDGYDAALVVTVPSLGGASVGATAGVEGAAAAVLATRADGAIVDSRGTFYVFAGGRAFGIPSPAALAAVRAADPATPLAGAVGGAETSAAMPAGCC